MNKTLLDYIYAQRWCSFKNEITDNRVEDIILESQTFDNGKKFFVIGKALIKDSLPQYFVMPLTTEKIENEPSLKFKGRICYDALKSSTYWTSLMTEIYLDKEFVLPNGYKLLYQSWDGFDFITNHIKDSSKPLGAEQSNTTLIVGNNVLAFKQQRMIEFTHDSNPEIEMNYNLMKTGCKVVPKTFGHLSLINENGESAFIGIVQEFVPNNGDLWEISKAKLLDILDDTFASNADVIPLSKYKNLYELMHTVGKRTSDLLKCLSSFNGNKSLISKTIPLSYIRSYKKSLKTLMQETKENIKNNINRLSSDMALNIQSPLQNWEKYISKFLNNNFNKIEHRKDRGLLMRVHGDFHLGQAIESTAKEIKFIDFSGEPNLTLSERKEKRSYMYDIAGMYRSISGYLPVVVAKHFATDKSGKINNEKLLWATSIIKPIIKNLSDAFLNELEIDTEWLEIEIFRRNLYEINYEIAYRPQMLFIPIDNLKELLLDNK
ncbi:MAG: hypothetical protein K6F04_02985 [bacterium]|nr:hypothetical protein [bacterium]